MRPKLADVARHAGVSEATVSRVLNGRPGTSGDAKRAVLAAIDVLGYDRPERLRKRGTGLVGLVVPELDNPIFPTFAQHIERSLTQAGYTPVLCTQTPGGVTEDEYIELLVNRGVAGIIFVSGRHADTTSGPERYQKLIAGSLPIVLVNGYLPDVPAPFVSLDHRAAGEIATSHLATLGHRRIGFVSGPRRYWPVQRMLAGYQATMRDLFGTAEADLDELIALSLFGVEGGQAATERLLRRDVTAVVCGSDMMALGAVRAVRSAGRSVPADISIVGQDDSVLMAFTDPALTTVRQPVRAMSAAAVQTLVDELAGEPAPRDSYWFRPELTVRASTAPPALQS